MRCETRKGLWKADIDSIFFSSHLDDGGQGAGVARHGVLAHHAGEGQPVIGRQQPGDLNRVG